MNLQAQHTNLADKTAPQPSGYNTFYGQYYSSNLFAAHTPKKIVKIPVKTAVQQSKLDELANRIRNNNIKKFTAPQTVPVRFINQNLSSNRHHTAQLNNYQTPYIDNAITQNTQSFIPEQRYFVNQNRSNQSNLVVPPRSLSNSINQKIYQKLYYNEHGNEPFDISNIGNYLIKILQIKKINILKIKKVELLKNLASATTVVIIALSLGNSFLQNKLFPNNNNGAVAGISENTKLSISTLEYNTWIQQQNNGKYAQPSDDLDKDGLTNNEEFILGSNPVSANTCDKNSTDSQNLLNLIDPATCKNIDILNNDQFARFSKVINIAKIQQQFTQNTITQNTTNSSNKDNNLLKIFGVTGYDQISKLSTENIKRQVETSQTKIDYLNTISKIEKYISKYRSYEPYDRDYASPVAPAKYLEVSIEYKVPLKYVLALARNESRFGTDKFDKDGNLTRPGQYQNIYSIGLTDSGSNLSFGGWDQGVEAFGKWYKKFQDKGVTDCRKWSIYNPNGDYCKKIEELAAEIEDFLNN